MKILLLDNYDSFTYNLAHLIKGLSDCELNVIRNDKINLTEAGSYDKIIISPGPGVPDQAGITKEIIRTYGSTKSILGVCLGCQAIAEVYGGNLVNLKKVYHGVESEIIVKDLDERLFRGLPLAFTAGRYHSWVVSKNDLPPVLRITAEDDSGLIMALAHAVHDVKGVQFHPESVMTPYGNEILKNWLNN